MATFASLKDKNDSLVVVARDLLVLAGIWGEVEIPDKLTDANGALIALPEGWKSAGEISRENAELAGNGSTENITGYGSLVPRRVIKTEESMRLSFNSQELRKLNYELFFGQDLTDTTVDESGEWRAYKSAAADIIYYSIILIGRDGSVGKELFPYYILPKVSVSSSGSISLGMARAMEFPIALDAYEDESFGPDGSYVAYGMAGTGNLELARAGGFAAPVTAISLLPATVSVAVGATTTLTVQDQDNGPITSGVQFTSSDPTKATVSAAGVVTGVATGSATITATYDGKTDTTTVTVTA
jgi:hypothetical protein